jgi:hypothetical protein
MRILTSARALKSFAAGAYVWIPFEHVASVEMGPPQRLRDTLWTPALVQAAPSFQGMDLGEVLIYRLFTHSPGRMLTRQSGWGESRIGRRTTRAGNIHRDRRFCWPTARKFPSSKSGRSYSPNRRLRRLSNKTRCV